MFAHLKKSKGQTFGRIQLIPQRTWLQDCVAITASTKNCNALNKLEAFAAKAKGRDFALQCLS
jgi:hypothetical protein